MPTPSLLQRLKERKLVQWAVAYLAGAWVLYEAVDTIGDRWGLPDAFFQGLAVLLAIGFFVALVIAWYHGEKGRQRASGPELLMVAALLVVAGVALATLGGPEEPPSTAPSRGGDDRPSLAVLPLDNFIPSSLDDSYFAEGLHEELTARISQISGMTVTSRSSVEQFRDPAARPSIVEMAAVLGDVDYFLEGSARMAGDMVRITVQLIDARTDGHVWQDFFDSPYSPEESIEVQTAIALEIASALQVEITPEEETRVSALPTANREAWEVYLPALAYWQRPGNREENLSVAQGLFEEAIGLDPTFATALTFLSRIHGQMYQRGYDRTPDRLGAQRATADSALSLQPDLPLAHLAVGYTHYVNQDFPAALDQFYTALEGLPNNETVVSYIAYAERRLGNWPQVFAAYERLIRLAPGATSYIADVGGMSFLYTHRYQDAIRAYDLRLTEVPADYHPAWYKGWAYWCLEGQLDTLRAMVEVTPGMRIGWRVLLPLYERDADGALAALGLGPDSLIDFQEQLVTRSLLSAWAHDVRGDKETAHAAFDSARVLLEGYAGTNPDDYRVLYGLGSAYAGLGRKEDAARTARRYVESSRQDVMTLAEVVGWGAEILASAGFADEAVDYLKDLLAGPSEICVNYLRTVWLYDPIRSNPRFQALLEGYADDVEH